MSESKAASVVFTNSLCRANDAMDVATEAKEAIQQNSIQVYATMAGVLSKLPKNIKSSGQYFQTMGYYSVNDGGGALYQTEIITKDVPLWAVSLDKKKNLYALILNQTVNYRMFGAKLDGETDDESALRSCHQYQRDSYTIEKYSGRKHYYVTVANHSGIIRKDSSNPIECCGNIDLSGSKLLVQSSNATWFGFYLWGDNDDDYLSYFPSDEAKATYSQDSSVINVSGVNSSVRPNSILELTETPYTIRDDDGYLYPVPKYELLAHTCAGMLASPFLYSWEHTGGTQIDANGMQSIAQAKVSRLPSSNYYFKGCAVKLETTADQYCSVLWVKCHNAHVSGFVFEPNDHFLDNKDYNGALIYIWQSYNVEVFDISGFSASGQAMVSSDGTRIEGGSGYMFRATGCTRLYFHDVEAFGFWGAYGMNCVKDVRFERVNTNRIDVHNYFYNLSINHCNIFNHAVQLGEGRGIAEISNTNFYFQDFTGDSYPHAHMVQLNTTYGRVFSGTLKIDTCNVYIKNAPNGEFDVVKCDFAENAVSTLSSFKFPNFVMKDCNFYAYDRNTYLVYFMISGKRNASTGTIGPVGKKDYAVDLGNDKKGKLKWKWIGQGIDWDGTNKSKTPLDKGIIVRTYSKAQGKDGKTKYYNYHYFRVTGSGYLPKMSAENRPTDYSGDEFDCGSVTLKAITSGEWKANKEYSEGDYVYVEQEKLLPVDCYKCVSAGTSNGHRPTHTTDETVKEASDTDPCYWKYLGTLSGTTRKFTSKMAVTKGELIYTGENLYKVLQSGQLNSTPPDTVGWFGDFAENTARLSYVGHNWRPRVWFEKDALCVSGNNVYQQTGPGGTTSGHVPQRGNGYSTDGDLIWKNTGTSTNADDWSKNYTGYNVNDTCVKNGNQYKCVYDDYLELPDQMVFENITCNFNSGGNIFEFDSDTSINTKLGPTKSWKISLHNLTLAKTDAPSNGYFGKPSNPAPSITWY